RGEAEKVFGKRSEAAAEIKGESQRARALWETAESQRLVGAADAAKTTMRRLTDETDKIKDPWARVSALRECAALAARLEDKKMAQSLFGRAEQGCQAIGKRNKLEAIVLIATAQANAGFLENAKKNAATI